MNWGSCYSASNNIHSGFPPLMDDGRNFVIGDTNVHNTNIKEKYGVMDNYEYRQMLIRHGDRIVRQNQEDACDQCCFCPNNHSLNPLQTLKGLGNSPNKFIYKSCTDDRMPYGFENSDLRNLYVSSTALQSRLYTPLL